MFLNALLLCTLSGLWALAFILVKMAEESLSPITVMVLRGVGAGLFLMIIVGFALRRDLKPLASNWKKFIFTGFMGIALFWICTAFAESRISAELATLFACAIPVFTFLITVIFLRQDRFSALKLFGILLAVWGIGVFIGLDALEHDRAEIIGVVLISAGFLAVALNGIYAATTMKDIDPSVSATGTIVYGTLFLAVAMFVFGAPLHTAPTMNSIVAVAVAGVLCTGLGYMIYFYLLDRAGPLFTSLFGYLMPLFAMVLSRFLQGDAFTWQHWVGAAITVTGAYLVGRRPAAA